MEDAMRFLVRTYVGPAIALAAAALIGALYLI
jgi:hypothetical protein